MRTYAVVRMVIERDCHTFFMKFLHKICRIRNQFPVPGVSVPVQMTVMTGSDLCVVGVPAHIENNVINREIILVISIYYIKKFIGSIIPIPAIPHTVNIFSRHRNFSRDGTETCKRSLEIIAVDEAILILNMIFCITRLYPVVDKQITPRIIDHIPSVFTQDAVVHRNLGSHAVECLHRSPKIIFRYETICKFFLLSIMCIKHIKI